MKFKIQKIRTIFLLASLMIVSGSIALRAEDDISSVNWPIVVNLSHMQFGDVFPGERLEKNFTVTYAGKGDGQYSIFKKYKPKPNVIAPSGYQGTISDYCQLNHEDFDRCYRYLCPFIEVQSKENEGDTVQNASVGLNDLSDLWSVILNTPSVGKVTQDNSGGMVSESGEYGCDLSFNVASIPNEPVCGNGTKEAEEECDDGNNVSGDGCSSACKAESCVPATEICDGKDNNCDGIIDNVFENKTIGKTPDEALLDCGTDVTSKVAVKNDGQCALQNVTGNQYINLSWNFDLASGTKVNSATLKLKHQESDTKMTLEGWDGSKYVEICSNMPNSSTSREDQCDISSLIAQSGTKNIKIRLKMTDPVKCHECLDWAYVDLNYGNPVTCPSTKGSISGCKYNDKNNNSKIDCEEEKMGGWEIQLVRCPYSPMQPGASTFLSKSTINMNPSPELTGYCSVVGTTVTGMDGCYSFTGLDGGDYGINETGKANWAQTSPESDKYYYLNLAAGADIKDINFLNHYADPAPPTCNSWIYSDWTGCSNGTQSRTIVSASPAGCFGGNPVLSQNCSSGGGGGGGFIPLKITKEKVDNVTDYSAKFTWLTNKKSDSRVICGKTSMPNFRIGKKPDYGYDFSSSTYDIEKKVTSHNVSIFGLDANTVYYCRVVSSINSEEAVSTELIFRTGTGSIITPPSNPEKLYIYNLILQKLETRSASLKWNTNINGTTCVVYSATSKFLGEKPKYGYEWNTAGCWDLSKQLTSHSITIGGLQPCTTYYFRLTSTNGTLDAVTEEQQVRTMCQVKSTYYPRTYAPSISTTKTTIASAEEPEEETGEVQAAQTQECPTCPTCEKCQNTVKVETVKEKYMACEDWLILLLVLIILTLLINYLVTRNRKKQEAGTMFSTGHNSESPESEKEEILD